MNALHGTCQGDFFTGVDPPKSLEPATAMIQTTTSEDPKATIATAIPASSPDAGAKNTATDVTLTRASPTTPTVEQAKEASSMVLDPKQGAPDPQTHVDSPALIMPQVKASPQPGPRLQETSSDFRQGISTGGYSTQAGNHDTPSLPFQNIASVPPMVSSDPASTTAPTSQGFDPANAIPTVTSPKPNPPSAHPEAALPATNDTPQDPSQTNQNPGPDPPRIAGANDLSTLRTAVDSVPSVDHAIYQSPVDPFSNPAIASPAAQAGDPAITAVGVQIGLTASASNIAVGGNNIPTEASALGATTTPRLHESLILDNNEVASPISPIENPKFGTPPIISHTTPVAIPAVNVVKPPLVGMLNIATVDGTHTILATPDHVPTNVKPGAPELNGQTSSSEALQPKIDDTRGHFNLGLPIGKADSTGSGDKSTFDAPTGKADSNDAGAHLAIDSTTGQAGNTHTVEQPTAGSPSGKPGSTGDGDKSTSGSPTGTAGSADSSDKLTGGSPTGKAGSTNTKDHSTSVLSLDKVGSSSSGTQILDGTYGTGDHSTLVSPTGNVVGIGNGTQVVPATSGTIDHTTSISPTGDVGSTGTGKQTLEGRARSWRRCVGWKRVGLTGLMMAVLL